MDFEYSESCDHKSSIGGKRERDSQLAQRAYEKTQDKKKEKHAGKMAAVDALKQGHDGEMNTPVKPSKPSKRRTTSQGAEKSEVKEEVCMPTSPADVEPNGPVVAASPEQKGNAKQRGRSKSADKRQQDLEKSLRARQAKAAANDKKKEEEELEAEAAAAAARRRAVWEAKQEEAALKYSATETETKNEATAGEAAAVAPEDELSSLRKEAAAASFAVAVMTDPDLEDWEVL